MFEFFESIANFFTTIIDFVLFFIEGLVSLVTTVGRTVYAVYLAAEYLPDVVAGMVSVILAYCVAINVLNKGG